MNAKEYLQKLQRLDTIINQKTGELEDLYLKLKSIRSTDYSKERVKSSPSGEAPFVKIINRITDLESEVNAEINRYMDDRQRIIDQIQGLQNSKYAEVLYKKYVEFKKLELISKEMNYTYQYIRKLHVFALREFERSYTKLH